MRQELNPTTRFFSTSLTTTNTFEQCEHAKKSNSKFLKLIPSKKRTPKFNASKIAIVDSEFQGKPADSKPIQFTVMDPKEVQFEKALTIRVKKVEGIMALLKAGKMLLDILKIETGKDSQFIAIAL
ncbi:MAG TPA: hypothetical protein VF172_00800 [Nitrososphaera sp.]